jgi:8-oxo-dGTP pyrophosphatase MutT (NUDIX family)
VTDFVFRRVRTLDCIFEPRPWDWAERESARIDAHWSTIAADNPALFDGRVLVQHRGVFDGDVFRGAYLETRFSRFIAWRDFGFPDTGVRNCFAMAALRSGDGAWLLGVMGDHTSNPGKVYFPAGTPDFDDVVGDRVDLAGSVLRELGEETGLRPGDVALAPDWTLIEAGPRVACMRDAFVDAPAAEIRARILAMLAQEEQPELSDIRIVRTFADIDEQAMPPFVSAYLRERLR